MEAAGVLWTCRHSTGAGHQDVWPLIAADVWEWGG